MMNDCCSSNSCKTSRSIRHQCPANGIEYRDVSARTIAHHVKQPWLWNIHDQVFFYCEDPECEVVYFADDDSVILKSQLRTEMGIKTKSRSALLCYCFGVTKIDAQQNPKIKNFVTDQTKKGICSCETSNPSGRCCLKDFSRTDFAD